MRGAWSEEKWLKEYYKYFACPPLEWVACLHLWKTFQTLFLNRCKVLSRTNTSFLAALKSSLACALWRGRVEVRETAHVLGDFGACVIKPQEQPSLWSNQNTPHLGSGVFLLGGKESQWAFKNFNVPRYTYLWYFTSPVTELLLTSLMLCGILINKRWH